jgi:gliding motility-associated-like protein
MKTIFLIIFVLIWIGVSGQIQLSTDVSNPSQIIVSDDSVIICDYNTVDCVAASPPSCSRNYSGKDLYFTFETPASGYAKIQSLFRNEVDFGIAIYDNLGNEISCTQVISNNAYVIVNDSLLIGSQIFGRIWINSELVAGRFELIFETVIPSAPKVLAIDINSASPQELVSDVLISGCVQVSNIQYTGHPESIGYFSNGSPGLDFESGIVLSTGKVVKAAGPNNSPAVCSNMQRPGDDILTAIINRQTYDAAILEFDFIPSSNVLSFQYAFGSEEYEEYVGGVFNDIFAFHISGGPEGYSNYNLAKIPGSNTPVSINNVNQNINTQWYYNNDNGLFIQYDGMTVTLTATASVTACETYHIRLAIADAADPIFDSGVFLKAGSFSSGTIPLFKNDNGWLMVNNTYEGCSNDLVFTRSDDNSIDQAFDFSIEVYGTALVNSDYSSFQLNLQIPAGEESVRIPYEVYADEIPEGTETIILRIFTECNCEGGYYEKTITINDPLTVSGTIFNNGPVCAGDSVNVYLDFDILPEFNRIVWSTGDTALAFITTSLSSSGYVSAEVFYPCGSEVFSTWVEVKPLPDAQIYSNAPICDGQNLEFSAQDGVAYLWKGPEGWSSTDASTVIEGALVSQSGLYGVTVTGDNGCLYREILDIQIHEWPVPILPENTVFCERDDINLSPGNFYAYHWEGPMGWVSDLNVLAISDIGLANSGSYFVTVSDNAGCTGATFTNILVNPSPTAQVSFNYPVCRGESINFQGNTEGNLLWQGPAGFISDMPSPIITDVDEQNSGIYRFYVENEFGCRDSVISEIIVTIPDAEITDAGIHCSSMAYIELESLYQGGTWSGEWIVNPLSGGFSPLNAGMGTHQVVYHIGYLGCEDYDTAQIIVELTPEIILDVPSAVCNNNGQVSLNAYPEGGTWSGVGIVNSQEGIFDPSIIYGSAAQVIYTWVEGSCVASDTASIQVHIGINAHIFNVEPMCENNQAIFLHSNQSSGVWSGTGIVNMHTGKFNPQFAGAGEHTIYFTASNLHCTDTDSITIIVDQYHQAIISADTDYCFGEPTVDLSTGIPSEFWSGFGVESSSQTFSPTFAGIGAGLVSLEIVNGACSSLAQSLFTVHQNSDAEFFVPSQFCLYDSEYQIVPVLESGLWFSAGIDDSISTFFDPTLAGEGIHNITHIVANAGCSDTVTHITEVLYAANPQFQATAVYCNDGEPEQLVPLIYGGLWSGSGITDTQNGIFEPEIAGVGAHLINYSIQSAECTSSYSRYLFVFDGNELIEFDLDSTYCNLDYGFVLNAIPSGGVWSGQGITYDSVFNPYVAGIGSHQLTYTIGTNNCLSSNTFNVTVTDVPEIEMTSPSEICPNEESFELNASLEGGLWSGEAVIDGLFYPNMATPGQNIVYYNYSNGNCNLVSSYEILVFEEPVISFVGLDQEYCKNYGELTFSVFPEGGSFNEPWIVESSNFNTEDLVIGFNFITYNVEFGNSCIASDSAQFEILESPEVFIEGLENLYCINSNDISFHAVPWGGTYEGIEISGNTFTPLTTGIGEHFLSYSYTAPNGCMDSFIHYLNIYGLPEISFEIINQPTCFNSQNGVLLVQSNENSSLFYENLPISSDGLVNNLDAGWHVFSAISEFGCQSFDSVYLEQPDSLSATINGTSVLPCGEEQGVLTVLANGGTQPYSYLWNDVFATEQPNLIGVSVGEYQLTITDANNCKVFADATISPFVFPDFVVDFSDSLDCYNSIDGFANISTSCADCAIEWCNGDDSFQVDGLSQGIYSFTISDNNGCNYNDSLQIIAPDSISVLVEMVTPICGEQFGAITIFVEGGLGNYCYEWQNGSVTRNLTNIPAGDYYVTITDNEVCAIDTVINLEFEGDIDANISLVSELKCFGDNNAILLAYSESAVEPLQFLWSNGRNESTIDNVSSGEYIVSLTDAYGCVAIDSFEVVQAPQILVIDSVSQIICKGEKNGSVSVYAFGGTGDLSCNFSNGQTGFYANNLSHGSYSYTVSDQNSCEYISTVDVTEPLESLIVNIEKREPLCFGQNTGAFLCNVSGGLMPYTYNWEWQGYEYTGLDLTNLYAGIYNLTLTDSNNCSIVLTEVLNEPTEINAIAISESVSCNGNNDGLISATAVGGVYPYKFYNGDSVNSNGLFKGLLPGVYFITAEDAFGCSSQPFSTSVGESSEECIRIPNAFTPNGDGINDKWEIENIHLMPYARIQVFNRWGQVVFETVSDNEIWDGTSFNGELPTGTYVYIIDPNNRSKSFNGTVNIVR